MKRRSFRPTYNKYKNKSCVCHQDHRHDSVKEAGYCDSLELLKKAGEIHDYRLQVTFPLVVNGNKICGHRVDFLVTTIYGTQEVQEVKGFATREWDMKRKLFEAVYPDIPYIVIT